MEAHLEAYTKHKNLTWEAQWIEGFGASHPPRFVIYSHPNNVDHIELAFTEEEATRLLTLLSSKRGHVPQKRRSKDG